MVGIPKLHPNSLSAVLESTLFEEEIYLCLIANTYGITKQFKTLRTHIFLIGTDAKPNFDSSCVTVVKRCSKQSMLCRIVYLLK